MIKTAQLANILAFGGYLAPCLAGTGDGPATFNEKYTRLYKYSDAKSISVRQPYPLLSYVHR